jgi:hypothetical protein
MGLGAVAATKDFFSTFPAAIAVLPCIALYCPSCTAACTAPCVLQGYDIMEDIYSAKTAAMTFLHELCKARAKGNLDMLMQVGGVGWGGFS